MSVVLQTALRALGQHVTKPRQVVFDAFVAHKGPVSVAQLIVTCSSIDRASVYRTIRLFESLGFVRRLNRGWKYELELTDQFTEHHHHLRCQNCGLSVDIHDDTALTKSITALAKTANFQPLDHELEVIGLCTKCAPQK